MSLLAFLVTTIYIPGYVGISIQPGWALLSIALPVATWRGHSLTPVPLQFLGFTFLAYALASLIHAAHPSYAIDALWQLGGLTFAFILGSQQRSLDPILKGLAVGLGLSSAVAVTQALGYAPVLSLSAVPSGLFFNPIILSEASALVLIWLIARRYWLYLPLAALGIPLSHARGGAVALAATLSVYLIRRHWLWAIPVCALGAVAAYHTIAFPTLDDGVRMGLWLATLSHLSLFGSGPGAMTSVAIVADGSLYFPEFAHNELLDFAFQYGLGLLPALALALAILDNTDADEWYPLFAFCILAAFSFPLHSPVLGFIGLTIAGYLSRDWTLAGSNLYRRGQRILSRLTHRRSGLGSTIRPAIPVLTHPSLSS